jgi:hypothetical protein
MHIYNIFCDLADFCIYREENRRRLLVQCVILIWSGFNFAAAAAAVVVDSNSSGTYGLRSTT